MSIRDELRRRTLATGLLGKDAQFELIVTGEITAAEIVMLIKKLEFDRRILAEADGEDG